MAVINVLVLLMRYGRLSKEEEEEKKTRCAERDGTVERSETGTNGGWGELCQHITSIRNGLVFT